MDDEYLMPSRPSAQCQKPNLKDGLMKKLITLLLVLCVREVLADDGVHVPDMSLLSWQIDSAGKVYLRNLSQFDSTFLGCCYNHYIDTTTSGGKIMWSAALSHIAMGKPMTFYVVSKSAAGPVTFVNN